MALTNQCKIRIIMEEKMNAKGHIICYKVTDSGERIKVYEHKNTIHVNMYQGFANSLVTRNNDASIDYMCWGTYSHPAGTFMDGTYVGTGAYGGVAGTNGRLTRSLTGSSARFLGTFGFTTTKQINIFQMGRGYNGVGLSSLNTSIYAYDNSQLYGSTWQTWNSGETLVVDWTITVGI